MSQVLLFTPSFFRGVVTAPSGNAYKVAPREIVTAEGVDERFLIDFTFLTVRSLYRSILITELDSNL